ncbi:MAG: CMP-N,N-diacetyllegionaminic acid synthase [Thermoleophilaceae bacterium]|jgi:CMP-N-acetylneuraminic acid synthetase|nr:CMP-N,N-diacetyllegionaminic acid synthase [Thermoleophilaceae bacterium]
MICVIPARRASKRVHEKVLREVGGVSMLERCIRTAVDSGVFDTIVLSTEDAEIAEIGRAHDLIVHSRPPELQTDTTGTDEITWVAARWLEQQSDVAVDDVACLSPVYPTLDAEAVREAVELFERSPDARFLIAVSPTDPHDFHWALEDAGEGYVRMFFGDRFLVDRAFLPPAWTPTGAIKLARLEALEHARAFFGERQLPFELPRERNFYVGEEIDIAFAEFLLQQGLVR